MIVKSMSRKEASFGQLTDYMTDIDKSDEIYNIYQNVYSRRTDHIEDEFRQNASLMAKRKNGNQMYHEILSISKAEKLSDKQQKEILRDIAQEYAQRRAGNNLVFGCLHDDHDHHLHYHLMITANEAGVKKRHRLTKAQFNKLKRDLESDVLRKYPELEQKVVINQTADEREAGKAKRAKQQRKPNQKEAVKVLLSVILDQAKSWNDFIVRLKKEGFVFYDLGKTVGIRNIETGKPHRLKTLGLLDEYQMFLKKIVKEESVNKPDNSSEENRNHKSKKEEKINIKTSKSDLSDDPVTQEAKIRKEQAKNIRSESHNKKTGTSRSHKK